MITHIELSADQMRTILAALDEGAAPTAGGACRGRGPRRRAEGRPLDLSLQDGQLLMRWCEARRERASEQQPDAAWTRVVAAVHEAVQPAAPAQTHQR